MLFAGVVIAIAGLVAIWDWNWFRPLVEREISAQLGRSVTFKHFAWQLGSTSVVVAEGVRIDNPAGFAQDQPFATAERLTVTIDTKQLLQHQSIVVSDIFIERPQVTATQLADGSANYQFPALPASGQGSSVTLGTIRIHEGEAHIILHPLAADFNVLIRTEDSAKTPRLIATAKGTYARQPINADFVGDSLLALQGAATPYAVSLKLQNGPTHASATGTLLDPLHFAGARVKLDLAGTNMELLLPLIGIAFPKTPSYQLTGDLDYVDSKIRFHNFTGRLGSSDLRGNADVDPGQKRPVVNAVVNSRQVDLEDLGGFIGSEPGRVSTPNQTPQQREAVARAEASPRLFPTTTISLPKLLAADVHLKYTGASILGHNMPFDRVAVDMDIVDGSILLHPISLGVGKGSIEGTIALTPVSDREFRTKADITLQRVDLGRMLQATNIVAGSGVFGGRATLDTTGNSMATMLANGNGSLKLTMAGGGDLSALLIDLSGLQFGNALLSALGIPARNQIQCLLADFTIVRGVMETRTLLLDTTSDITSGSGTINLRTETLDYEIKTEPKHFTIGTLSAPIAVTGSFKGLGVMPNIATLAARSGAAVGLGILFPPAAILPTIQFGVGDDHRCEALTRRFK
jgi:uncharacterized protein involved in outer membrane biogenesis